MITSIALGEWAPDQPDLANALQVASNVYPHSQGYTQARDLAIFSDALGAACIGAASFRNKSGTLYSYAGTTAALYQSSGSAWTAVTDAEGAYGVASTVQWEFVEWGDEVLATAYYDGTDTNADTFPSKIAMGGANFNEMITDETGLRATHIGVCRDFVLLGNIHDGSNRIPNRVWWSAFADETLFTPSTATQAGYQDLYGTGWVQRIVSGEYATVVCERGVWRFSYVGPPQIFQADLIVRDVGTVMPWSVAWADERIWWYSADGFVELSPAGLRRIGEQKVDAYFRASFSKGYEHKVSAVADPRNKRVLWAYPNASATSGTPNRILVYSWELDRWSELSVTVEVLCQAASGGYILDNAVFKAAGIYADLDAGNIPDFDSDIWRGGQYQVAGFSTAHKLGTLDGDVLAASLETHETQLGDGRVILVRGLRPLVQGGTATTAVGSRNRQTDAVSWGAASTMGATGHCDHRVTGRYHRMRLAISGGFEHALGVEADLVPAGVR